MMARLHHPHIVQFLGFAQVNASDELCIKSASTSAC